MASVARAEAPRLLLVGCGELGSAMLRRWISTRQIASAHIVKPSPLPPDLAASKVLTWSSSLPDELGFIPDAIILAVRPPTLESVLPTYARFRNNLFLSVLAGKTIATIEKILAAPAGAKPPPVIRVMPNMPALVGHSASFGCVNQTANADQKNLAESLMKAVGTMVWLQDEGHFDLATALSGCGPAYVFAFTEALAAATEQLGLPPSLARQLARQTVIGSAAFLDETQEEAADLRDRIGNPGTMTEAALRIFAAGGLTELVKKAIATAEQRAKELGR